MGLLSNNMSSQACLKFDLFQNFVVDAQTKIKGNKFCDVTLVSEDNQKFEAHKVIISSASTIFWNMLVNEKHPNPLIFMRGVKANILEALLEFIYCGEAKVEKEDVEEFIKLRCLKYLVR